MRKLIPGMLLVGSLVACDTMQLAEYVPQEYAWAGSTVEPSGVVVVNDASADSVVADSVTFLLYAVLEESGSAEGVLTILNDTALAYDPYEVLVDGFMTRGSVGAPAAMLAEYTRYDGARCRMYGLVDSLGWWNSEVGCGGVYKDSVRLRQIKTGVVSGVVNSDGDPAQGVRVWYCVLEETSISQCRGAAYSGIGGRFRFDAPPGEWFVIFSIWDPIFDEWDYCRSTLGSTSYRGRRVNVRLGQVVDATVDCPWFI